jgi:hypothetical protein
MTQNTTQSTSVRTIGVQSTPRVQQTPASILISSTSPDPTLESML